MADYNSMYLKLFNAVTDAINILQKAQTETEGMYIEHEPVNVTLLKPDNRDEDEGGQPE